MRRRYQGGSLAGFIIVGVLLTLVLVGGLYGLNRYNAQQAGEEVASDQEAKPETDAKKQTEQKNTTDDKKAESAPSSGTQSSSPSAASGSTSSSLPTTGPADTFMNIVAATLLGFAGVHYVRSRRSTR